MKQSKNHTECRTPDQAITWSTGSLQSKESGLEFSLHSAITWWHTYTGTLGYTGLQHATHAFNGYMNKALCQVTWECALKTHRVNCKDTQAFLTLHRCITSLVTDTQCHVYSELSRVFKSCWVNLSRATILRIYTMCHKLYLSSYRAISQHWNRILASCNLHYNKVKI